jgi:hypothetical protein
VNPETPLDAAFLASDADPDPALRLRFHERVLDAELAVALAGEGEETLAPRVFDLEDGRFVLAFDRDERLADFLGPTDFAALSGRRLATLLAGRGVGIALNLGAPSATLLPSAAVDWLAEMARPLPELREARLGALRAPEVPAPLAAALAAKLAAMADAVPDAHLVAAQGVEGREALVLVLTGVPEDARPGVAAAVAEAVRFTAAAPEVDLAFLDAGSDAAAAVARSGLRLHLPAPEEAPPSVPGMDPGRPPRLR